jgi:CHAT domain-containing protein/Tfp pilus assembly protein PilF
MYFAGGCNADPKPEVLYADARLKLTEGFFEAALKEANQGYREAGRDNPLWSWRFRLLQAEVYLRQGKPDQSVELLSPDPPPDSSLDILARRRIVQAEALCRVNRSREAEAAIHDAEPRIPSGRRDLQAGLAFARGRCSLTADRRLALRYYREAASLAHGDDSFVEASSLINIGLLLFQDQSYVQAMQELDKVLLITDSRFLKEKTLGNLAECYAELGDWKRSIALAEQAEKLASQINEDGDREKWLIDLGRAHFALAEFTEAEPYYRQALAIAAPKGHRDVVRRCLNNLTQLALKRHDPNAAEQYWKEESVLVLDAEGRSHVSFDGATLAVEQKQFARAENLFKELLASKPKDSLRLTTERELASVYWQENKIADADRMFREAINDAEALIARLPAQYRMSFLDEDPFYDSYVRFLVAQGRSLDGLKIAERGRAQILSQAFSETLGKQSAFDLLRVQAVLKRRDQIALAYLLTNDESFVWVITPKQLRVISLAPHKTIGRQVEAYNREILDHPRPIEDSPAGTELYRLLVQPAESLIPKGSRIVVICSKMLSLLNFESLIVPGPQPHYWIEDVEIETASSLALLARSKPANSKAAARKQLFLLGAPVPASDKFPALPHAEEEMQCVQSHFRAGQETILSGPKAVPQAYRGSDPGEYRFIHIDAHSVASEVNPLDSFFALSPDASHGYELKADEIKDTPLRAELVTLSACYSAGTRWYNGEGIVGLGWAFLRAGAHQVVASLWAVDDASTPQLMDDFYGGLTKGKSAAEALRSAKLNMLHSKDNHSRPFYWASLQLYTGS